MAVLVTNTLNSLIVGDKIYGFFVENEFLEKKVSNELTKNNYYCIRIRIAGEKNFKNFKDAYELVFLCKILEFNIKLSKNYKNENSFMTAKS